MITALKDKYFITYKDLFKYNYDKLFHLSILYIYDYNIIFT